MILDWFLKEGNRKREITESPSTKKALYSSSRICKYLLLNGGAVITSSMWWLQLEYATGSAANNEEATTGVETKLLSYGPTQKNKLKGRVRICSAINTLAKWEIKIKFLSKYHQILKFSECDGKSHLPHNLPRTFLSMPMRSGNIWCTK